MISKMFVLKRFWLMAYFNPRNAVASHLNGSFPSMVIKWNKTAGLQNCALRILLVTLFSFTNVCEMFSYFFVIKIDNKLCILKTCFILVTFLRKATYLLGCHQIILRQEVCHAYLFRRTWVRITEKYSCIICPSNTLLSALLWSAIMYLDVSGGKFD